MTDRIVGDWPWGGRRWRGQDLCWRSRIAVRSGEKRREGRRRKREWCRGRWNETKRRSVARRRLAGGRVGSGCGRGQETKGASQCDAQGRRAPARIGAPSRGSALARSQPGRGGRRRRPDPGRFLQASALHEQSAFDSSAQARKGRMQRLEMRCGTRVL